MILTPNTKMIWLSLGFTTVLSLPLAEAWAGKKKQPEDVPKRERPATAELEALEKSTTRCEWSPLSKNGQPPDDEASAECAEALVKVCLELVDGNQVLSPAQPPDGESASPLDKIAVGKIARWLVTGDAAEKVQSEPSLWYFGQACAAKLDLADTSVPKATLMKAKAWASAKDYVSIARCLESCVLPETLRLELQEMEKGQGFVKLTRANYMLATRLLEEQKRQEPDDELSRRLSKAAAATIAESEAAVPPLAKEQKRVFEEQGKVREALYRRPNNKPDKARLASLEQEGQELAGLMRAMGDLRRRLERDISQLGNVPRAKSDRAELLEALRPIKRETNPEALAIQQKLCREKKELSGTKKDSANWAWANKGAVPEDVRDRIRLLKLMIEGDEEDLKRLGREFDEQQCPQH
jgi:hypothetical protein